MQRELVLEGGLSIVEGLAKAMTSMLEEARAQARRALEAPGEAVHDYRRALRRAEAIIALAWPMLRNTPRKYLSTSLERARSRTRILRDLDAVVPVVGRLAELGWVESVAGGGLTDSVVALAAWVEACRGELASDELVAWRLRKNVRALAGLGDIFQVALHAWVDLEVVMESARGAYREARRAWKQAIQSGAIDDLHALRRKTRTLRYALELLASNPELPRHEAIAAQHLTFKSFVKELGNITDLLALRDIVGEADEDLAGFDAEGLARALGDLIESRQDRALNDAATLFAVRPRAFLADPELELEASDSADVSSAEVAAPSTEVAATSPAPAEDANAD